MTAPDPVQLARGWLGTPWCHGAAVRGRGCDCLGLVRGVWAEMGADLPRLPPYAPAPEDAQHLHAALEHHLRSVPMDAALVAGQVLLLAPHPGGPGRHLGILSAPLPQARFIHAYARHGVVESPLSAPWARRIVARFSFS
jgi:NlpC/P60 family putative phage cell wall peptidase